MSPSLWAAFYLPKLNGSPVAKVTSLVATFSVLVLVVLEMETAFAALGWAVGDLLSLPDPVARVLLAVLALRVLWLSLATTILVDTVETDPGDRVE